MSTTPAITVHISMLEEFRYFMAHQPPFLGLLLAYGVICLAMFWMTRGYGYLIAFASGFCYLVPYLR